MAVSNKKYNVIDLETGKLDPRIFSDPDIYQEELEKIFGRAWLMIGHDSLVPEVNDFFHTYMGEDPVILTRDDKGKVHAFLNMCRHRGNRIVRADIGNAKNFMCSYHGWTYSNKGDLEYVPGEEEAYYGALAREGVALGPASEGGARRFHGAAAHRVQLPSRSSAAKRWTVLPSTPPRCSAMTAFINWPSWLLVVSSNSATLEATNSAVSSSESCAGR